MNILQKIKAGGRLLLDSDVRRISKREKGINRNLQELPKVDVITVDKTDELQLVKIDSIHIWIPLNSSLSELASLYSEIYDKSHAHQYEYDGCRLNEGDVVIDAGACEGFFTRYCLDRGCKVVAIEPWKRMYESLNRTFMNEIKLGKCIIQQFGLSDSQGFSSIDVDLKSPWGAKLSPVIGDRDQIKLQTLDTIVENTWKRCDFIKMDIEGAEHKAIRGAQATLQSNRPKLSVAVYHSPLGFVDMRGYIKSLDLGYNIEGKGIHKRSGIPFPMMLHAWPRDY
jgi:FkbM family methyltransferase